MSYVRAAKELPYLTEDEVKAKAREYGAMSSDEEFGGEIKDDAEDEKSGATRQEGALM